jgi:branched-chain amino acid transport system permease protein
VTEVAWPVRALSGAALLALLLLPFSLYGAYAASPGNERFLTRMLINVVLVVGLQSFIGNTGVVSFGHIAFMGIGAYVAALASIPTAIKVGQLQALPDFVANAELGFWPVVLVAGAVTAVVALVIGIPLSRLSGGAGSIATLGVLIVGYVVFANWNEVTGGVRALYGVPHRTSVMTTFIVAVGAITIARVLRESSIGLKLRASADEPTAAETSGVEFTRLRLMAWLVSGLIVGFGGALFAQDVTAFAPSAFYFSATFMTLAMLIIGGLSSVTGAVCGAVLVTLAARGLDDLEDGFAIGGLHVGSQLGLSQLVLALLILGTMITRPQGLVGRREADELVRVAFGWPARVRARASEGFSARRTASR